MKSFSINTRDLLTEDINQLTASPTVKQFFNPSFQTENQPTNFKMKSVLAMILFAAAASAQYQSAPMLSYGSSGSLTTPVPIIRLNQNIGESGVTSDFEAGNGIKSQENTDVFQGATRTLEDGSISDKEIKKSGSYSYTAPDGQVISTSYVADASGFHVSGSHLPVPVEMPAELKAAYAEVAARPVGREVDSYASAPVRSAYSAPLPVRSAYSAPLPVRMVNAYSAPLTTLAPEIRINYAAPVRSTY